MSKNFLDASGLNQYTDAIKNGDIIAGKAVDASTLKGTDVVSLIPTQATSSNKLADKNFVNSSIATATSTYRGNYNQVSDLNLSVSSTTSQVATALATKIATADNNDYCYVQVPTSDSTPTQIQRIDRYKHNGTSWLFEYSLNNSGFTAAQWEAINSNITAGLVEKLSALPTNSDLQAALNAKYVKPSGGIPDSDLATSYLPLSAGSTKQLTGELFTSNPISIIGVDNKKFQFTLTTVSGASNANVDIGWNWTNRDGAGAAFRSSHSSLPASAIGAFDFFARDSSNSSTLHAQPNGVLTWNSKNIVTEEATISNATIDAIFNGTWTPS